MGEETKTAEAAKHLLRLGNGSLVPASSISLSHQERTRGLDGSSISNRKNRGPFRNGEEVERPIREYPVVDGQFDDAYQPPSLPPLRVKARPARGASGYFGAGQQSRAPIPPNFPPPSYGPTSTTNHPGLGAIPTPGQVPPVTFPTHFNPSIRRGQSPDPNLPLYSYRGVPHYHSQLPAAGNRLGLQPIAPRPTGTNPPPNSTITYSSAASDRTQHPSTSNSELSQQYFHVPTSDDHPWPQPIAPRPVTTRMNPPPNSNSTNFSAAAARGPESRNNASEKKRGRSRSYGTVIATRCDKNKKQNKPTTPATASLHLSNEIIVEHPSPLLIPDSAVPYSQRIPDKPYVAADAAKTCPISELRDTDVLMGRGGQTNHNAGNIWFRDLISHYRMTYCTVVKGDKRQLAANVRNYVRTCSGRFLERDKNDKKWYECGDDRAVLKVGQALREGTAEVIRKKLRGKPDSTSGDEEEHDDGDDAKDKEKTNDGEKDKDRESKRQRLG
jgi:hypothetical protein